MISMAQKRTCNFTWSTLAEILKADRQQDWTAYLSGPVVLPQIASSRVASHHLPLLQLPVFSLKKRGWSWCPAGGAVPDQLGSSFAKFARRADHFWKLSTWGDPKKPAPLLSLIHRRRPSRMQGASSPENFNSGLWLRRAEFGLRRPKQLARQSAMPASSKISYAVLRDIMILRTYSRYITIAFRPVTANRGTF